MNINALLQPEIPTGAGWCLLQDAACRDRSTARRLALLEILWEERYLQREQLIARVEAKLGQGCFGNAAWEDTFARDMRIVRKGFAQAGYELKFSRSKYKPGYYLKGEGTLHPILKQAITAGVAEVDPRQIDIFRNLTFAQRFRQGSSISDTARWTAHHVRQGVNNG